MKMQFGFAGRHPHDLDILPFDATGPACAERFECSFFCGKTRGVMDLRLRAFLAVLDLTFCIYSIEETITEAVNGIADSLVLDDVDADAGDHEFVCYR